MAGPAGKRKPKPIVVDVILHAHFPQMHSVTSSDDTNKLFTGTAGEAPAASAKREPTLQRSFCEDHSRLMALVAGEAPAVPVELILNN
jgi:hypothetical protein